MRTVAKTIYLLCLILFSFSSCTEDHAGHFPSEVQVNSLMNEAMEKSDLPALVAIAINTKGEKIIYTHGPAVWKEDAPVTPDHIFRIYSMTKLLTSIAALQLVEKEVIGLDDDLSELMPEMDSIPILKNGELIEPKNKITLRHLLTHTSGFGYMGATVSNEGFDDENWEYKDSPRHFESGTQFLYGTSTDWVGMLVEKLSGMNLEEYFHLHITTPLGMTRTFFNVPDSLQAYIVSRGTRGEDGKQKLTESSNRIPASKATFLSGGGGLFSSPADYAKLLHCLLNEGEYDGGSILTKETIDAMNRNQVGAISLDPEGRYFEPGTCCRFNELMDENSKWGLAFMIDNTVKAYGRQAGTVTWGGYYNTYFYIDFKSGIAASIYSQHRPFNHIQTTSLFEKFSEIIYSQ
jgi:CubicO group peptidase (beta-lactamase class C family)